MVIKPWPNDLTNVCIWFYELNSKAGKDLVSEMFISFRSYCKMFLKIFLNQ